MDSKTLRYTTFIICLLHVFISIDAAYFDSLTVNELSHIGSGIAYLRTGTTSLYSVNPPISKAILAMPLSSFLGFQDSHLRRSRSISNRIGTRKPPASISRRHKTVPPITAIPINHSLAFGAYIIWQWTSQLFGAGSERRFHSMALLSFDN